MNIFLNTIMQTIEATWDVLLESSIFILFGFFIAGLLKGFLPGNFIYRHLGGNSFAGIFKASLFGIPIPLCSCGVIPAASGLRQQGASKGAVGAFMISTPETGVDSIAVTYALLDPVMTIIRPVAAFLTAMTTGIIINLFDRLAPSPQPRPKAHGQAPLHFLPTVPPETGHHQKKEACSSGCCSDFKQDDASCWQGKFRQGMHFAFGDLLHDIGSWLLLGIMLSGSITVFISPDFITTYMGNGLLSMLIMIALATPLYICATASTPIAAALALKGLAPGAALVFLLAGPATNMATITVVARLLGKRTAALYVFSIMVCSLTLGVLVNWLYLRLGINIVGWVHEASLHEHTVFDLIAALILLALVGQPWLARLHGFLDRNHLCIFHRGSSL